MTKTIETNLNYEGYVADIEVENEVVEDLATFLKVNKEVAYEHLKDAVVDMLDEYNEKLEFGETEDSLSEKVIFAIQERGKPSTNESIVFKLNVKVNRFNDLVGKVTK